MARPRNDDREMSSREMDDREASTLDDEEYRPAGDLNGFTPPEHPGEHFRWVARGKDDEGRYRSRVAEGYRPMKFEDRPDFRPWKNLLLAGVVQPTDVVTQNHDLILMVVSEKQADKRNAYFRRQTERQVESASPALEQQPGMPGKINVQSSMGLERHGRRPPKEVSFGE